ncbi:MAG TPA: hypothetical protein ACFE0H_04285 [Elainellaceae cyanobacterium]
MNKWHCIGSIGLIIIGSAIARPAAAQPFPNLSDISGTNVFNSVAPDFFDDYGDRLDPEVLAEARRLAAQLEDAYASCVDSIERSDDSPRRFARGPAPSQATTAECEDYNRSLGDTQRFLARVQDQPVTVDPLRERPW